MNTTEDVGWPGLISSEHAFPPGADDVYRLSRTVTSPLTLGFYGNAVRLVPALTGMEKAGVFKVTEMSARGSQRVGLLTETSFTFFMDGWLIRWRLIDFQPFSGMRTGYLSVKIIIIISETMMIFFSIHNKCLFQSPVRYLINKPRLEIISPSWRGWQRAHASYTPLPGIITSIRGAG